MIVRVLLVEILEGSREQGESGNCGRVVRPKSRSSSAPNAGRCPARRRFRWRSFPSGSPVFDRPSPIHTERIVARKDGNRALP